MASFLRQHVTLLVLEAICVFPGHAKEAGYSMLKLHGSYDFGDGQVAAEQCFHERGRGPPKTDPVHCPLLKMEAFALPLSPVPLNVRAEAGAILARVGHWSSF